MNETCTDCAAPATCEYDWGTGLKRACADHDPLRYPYGATMARVPSYYRTIWQFPVLATTGIAPPVCNCAYGAVTAICPVHVPARPVVTC